MPGTRQFVVSFVIIIAFLLFVPAGGSAQPAVINAGFESASPQGMPAGWTVLHEGPASAGIDARVCRSGNASLMVRSDHPGSLTLVSSPVHLTVGKLYRLSGWIRTDHAQADPLGRYPTPVAAALAMSSFPFTTYSTPAAGTGDWKYSEAVFFATRNEDQVRIQFGVNGAATGTAWFDDINVEEVTDITQYIPMETVRWHGPAFRYTDKGWTFIHIEGKPYARGVQYGSLMAKEIAAFIEQLAVRSNPDNARQSWNEMRTLADALMLRKYDEEYLTEMKGIADGVAQEHIQVMGRGIDLLDVVTLNSAVDLGQLGGALAKTATPLTGRNLHAEEEEANTPERLHKCSSFLANGPATPNGEIVFGQLFMWNGYTGAHWEVICDVQPSDGHRLVYETFPGGIHSGADFYINDAGIMIGETTVMQTPFDEKGSPQSSRIRKAAQYAESIDDVVKLLTSGNNGLYTNDWLIGDANTNETAILLLGTAKWRLWRSGKGDFPGGTTGFLWSVNNAKDPEVRKEYVPDPGNAPFDLVFNSTNRDVAFYEFYQKMKGRIDAEAAVRVLASSPINRPHACDGKVTTSEMARHMMLLANFGKVTLREKFPEKNSRLVADLPNAIPHLSLGYTAFSPITVTSMLQALHAKDQSAASGSVADNFSDIAAVCTFDKNLLWFNTVYPATEAESWFVSGSAAYWSLLNSIGDQPGGAEPFLRDQLADLNCRLLYTVSREGSLAPVNAHRDYAGYKNYIIPRVKGTFLLHQVRLLLGNEMFSRLINAVHDRYKDKPMSTADFAEMGRRITGRDLKPLLSEWLDRDGLPKPRPSVRLEKSADGWTIKLKISQPAPAYAFATTVAIQTEKETRWQVVRVDGPEDSVTFTTKDAPRRVLFNAGNDIPVPRRDFYTFSNIFDEFKNASIVYGTSREIEANHTLALRYQTMLADRFTEDLLPVTQDIEADSARFASSDLIVLGGASDNAVTRMLAGRLGVKAGQNMFEWRGTTYAGADDGIALVYPNPFNPQKTVYLLVANSALQLYQMSKAYQPVPSWAIFKGDQILQKGYHPADGMDIDVQNGGKERAGK